MDWLTIGIWACALFAASCTAAVLYMRAAIISLNQDMRAILAGQSEIRARIAELEERR
jgi:hypothetical protein